MDKVDSIGFLGSLSSPIVSFQCVPQLVSAFWCHFHSPIEQDDILWYLLRSFPFHGITLLLKIDFAETQTSVGFLWKGGSTQNWKVTGLQKGNQFCASIRTSRPLKCQRVISLLTKCTWVEKGISLARISCITFISTWIFQLEFNLTRTALDIFSPYKAPTQWF